jgi:hypothetical protein
MSTPAAGTPGTNTGQPSGDQGATPPGTPPAGQNPPPQPPSGGDTGQPPPGQADDAAKLKAALDRERQLRRDAEKRAKDGEAAQKRADDLEAAGKSETERAVATARKEGAAEALTKANTLLVRAEARAAAAGLHFQDPRDVLGLIDLSDVRVTDDGTVDADVIAERLRKLAEDKPYLVAAATPPTPPEPQGPRAPRVDPSQGSGRQPAPTAGTRGAAEAARRFGQPAAAGTTN